MSGPAILGVELVPPLERLIRALGEYDLNTQRLVIGFLMVRHAVNMGDAAGSEIIVAGLRKHTNQILRQHGEFARAEREGSDGGMLDGDRRVVAMFRMLAARTMR